MKNKIIISIGIILICILGYWIYNKKSEIRDATKMENKVVINADELYKIYSEYEDSANKLYLDKPIDLTGSIREIELNDNRYTLYIHTGDSMANISCEMDTTQNSAVKKLIKNEQVNINGFCNGINIDIELDRCKLVKK